MTRDEAFALALSKHGISDGLPWEPSHEFIRKIFDWGWDARGEADKQTVMFPATGTEPYYTPADIYEAYPRHEGRGAALKAIEKAIKKVGDNALYTAVVAYAAAVKTWPPTARFTVSGSDTVPHAATWMNQERWTDDRQSWQRGAVKHTPSQFGQKYT